MRIAGGKHRGRPLLAPQGKDTRPTEGRARESLFNILLHAGWLDANPVDGAFVMDAFAGTGALGLEALSRGAAHAAFAEKDPRAMSLCRQNAEKLGEAGNCLFLPIDVLKIKARPPDIAPRGLVFLDPPYGRGLAAAALAALDAAGWLAPHAVTVMEMSRKAPEETPPGFRTMDERRYGLALLRFLKKAGPAES